ncbi:hypothetical protein NKI59_31780 [Mesorhizobium sp. M0598]|uniref:hypothetical protein n=1 Tax=Mesorhizobium sp. M0598 TaxID=2956968 RepID=UPI003338BD66
MKYLRRLAVTLLCYALAAFTMSLVFFLLDALIWWRVPAFLSTRDSWSLLLLGAMIAGIFGAPLAIPMVIASQVLEARRWILFVVGGAFVGTCVFAVWKLHLSAQRPPDVDVLVALIIAGSLAGAVYRLVESRFLQMPGQFA